MSTDWQCPECGGEWLRNFVFRHNPRECSLRAADDATQMADHERLFADAEITRPATATELQLVAVFALDLAALETGTTKVSRITYGVHTKTVAEINPDTLVKENS